MDFTQRSRERRKLAVVVVVVIVVVVVVVVVVEYRSVCSFCYQSSVTWNMYSPFLSAMLSVYLC